MFGREYKSHSAFFCKQNTHIFIAVIKAADQQIIMNNNE